MSKELHQVPLGSVETDEEIGVEAACAVAEEERVKNERELIDEAMKQEGFVSYEERKREREEGPGRRAALALLEELRRKEEEKKRGTEKKGKETLF